MLKDFFQEFSVYDDLINKLIIIAKEMEKVKYQNYSFCLSVQIKHIGIINIWF